MKILEPDYTDDPVMAKKIVLPPALHDRMKEVAQRRRVHLGVVYEEALRELLDQFDDMHNSASIPVSSRVSDEPSGKPVNIKIHEGVHSKVRRVANVSAIYELAAKEFLDRVENYLGEGYTSKSEKEFKNNGKQKETVRKTQRKKRGSTKTGKTRR